MHSAPTDVSAPPRPSPHWKSSDIAWHRFDRALVTPDLLWVVRATCLVESRADLYASYVADVLRGGGREDAVALIESWGQEEAQHGAVLGEWLRLADPAFHFDDTDREYRGNVKYYQHSGQSVRGSLQNELLCRCVIESLASAYYRALEDSTREPVLREICDRLSRDEARHYAWFRRLLEQARRREPNGLLRDFRVMRRRIKDLENDQIAFAFHCSDTKSPGTYSSRLAAAHFLPLLYRLYRVRHITYAGRLLLGAVDIRLPRSLVRVLAAGAFVLTRARATLLRARWVHGRARATLRLG